MAITNQGYRRDLNLSETENEQEAISNLMGTGIDADIRYLQNNLRNVSRVPFNNVDAAGFFSFAEDKTLAIQSIASDESPDDPNDTRVRVTLTEPYLLKGGNLVEISIPDTSAAFALNGQYVVSTISTDLTIVTLFKNNLVYVNSNVPISGVSFTHKPENIFTFTDGDVINLSEDIKFQTGNTISGTNVLTQGIDYYVIESNGINKFKLSTSPNQAEGPALDGRLSQLDGFPQNKLVPDNFQFIRQDPVHRDQILFFRYPEIQDNDFNYLGNNSINDTITSSQSNIESAEYFTTKKYRGDKTLVSTDESIKYEGSIVLNDPNNYNSSSDFVLNVGVTGAPAPGIYIGGTRAFSSDNNPWGKEGVKNTVGSALTTSSEEVSIGELSFLDGSLLNPSEEGSMIIEGIENDVADVSVIASSFTHKIPIKVEDANGNQESYFLLVSDT